MSILILWTFSHFHVLAIINVNKSVINIRIQIPVWNSDFIPFRYLPRSGIALGILVVLFLIFWGTFILFSIVAVPTCISITCTGALFSPHLHQFLLPVAFLIIGILTAVRCISLWFWFEFPWRLVILSTFSCACWLSVYLWKIVSSGPLPTFNWITWGILLLNCMGSLCVFGN